MHPATNGATIVYDTYILPQYQEYEGQINALEKQATDKLKEAEAGARQFVDDKKKSWTAWSLIISEWNQVWRFG